MICDFVRWAYTTQMVFWPGGDPITVKWYRCPDAAKVFPFAQQFGSRVWDNPDFDQVEGLGELPNGKYPPADFETPPFATGQNFCGRPEWWVTGQPVPSVNPPAAPMPIDLWGLPGCCTGNPGGLAFGGAAFFSPLGPGGLWFGGSAIIPFGWLIIGDGGMLWGGSSQDLQWTFSAGGGLRFDGQAGDLAGYFVGDGGLRFDGQAGDLAGFFVGDGGLQFGGSGY